MDTKIPDLSSYIFEETPFMTLMQKRIYRVLIVCSNYDYYMLQEDGRIDEIIFNEYVGLNLRYPPIFRHANSSVKAELILDKESIDLVIVWLAADSHDAFDIAREIKNIHPQVPIVALTHYSGELQERLRKADTSAIDSVFHWNGNADIFLAIIKLAEDKMNLDHDVEEIGVQAILLVEDSIRYYSSYLPHIYRIILTQTRSFVHEALNEHKRMLRMRGRPKIILATNYEDAVKYYDRLKPNLLGVISDITYPRLGKKDGEAGFLLAAKVKQDNKYCPVLLQSSNPNNMARAREMKVGFMDKNSERLSVEIRDFIMRYFAFGEFEFKNQETKETVAKAGDLRALQQQIEVVSCDVLYYHVRRNHLSKWLRARTLFPLADLFAQIDIADFETLEIGRAYLLEAIVRYRRSKSKGVIGKFDCDRYDEYMNFSRIGDGALGGKGRGLAFVDSFLKKHRLAEKYDNVTISIPRTVVVSTSVFDVFMDTHNLYGELAEENLSDDEVLNRVVTKELPEWVLNDLRVFVRSLKAPIAVRSSSVLEDSHYQPFAGIFSTYMIPNNPHEVNLTIEMLARAIKSVYASVFFRSSKAYLAATSHSVHEGKMAVIMQEVIGSKYERYFYPNISGVARSINFYPIGHEKADEGIASIAFGLGRITVEGGRTLRVSPAHPDKVLQLSSADSTIRETQKKFFALDLAPDSFTTSINDGVNIKELRLKEAPDLALKQVASTYDLQNHTIRPGISLKKGKRVITFDNVLKYNVFPLASIFKDLLRYGQREMANPVEIEFAVNLNTGKNERKIFSVLQIRPIVENNEETDVLPTEVNMDDALVYSEAALGNGNIEGIFDIVYVKPETFDAAHSRDIAQAVEAVNKRFLEEEKKYILIGPGRWGSSDPWLGIPVIWPQISQAKVIIEAGLKDYRIDPSQGTHFFQNLTSFKVGYFTINPYLNDGAYDLDYLNNQTAVFEDEYIRHIRFEENIAVKIDGKNNRGVIYKSGVELVELPSTEEDLNLYDGIS